MTRRGATLVEMTALLAVVVPLGGATLVLAHQLSQQRPPTDGRRLEAVLLRWRQEARHGVVAINQGLATQEQQWTWRDGALLRNEVPQIPAEVRVLPGPPHLVVLELRAPDLPPRTVEFVRRQVSP